MKSSAARMSPRRSATIRMCATSTPRSRSRSDSHGPLRSEMIPDSTSVPVMRMPARGSLAGRPPRRGQLARALAGAQLVADRVERSGTSIVRPPARIRAWPLPKVTRKRRAR